MIVNKSENAFTQLEIAEISKNLTAISQLSNKNEGWITQDLSVHQSSCLTRILFTAVAKYFYWIREIFFSINLERSRQNFEQIKVQVLPYAQNLIPLFNKAVLKFNDIAPRYSLDQYAIPAPIPQSQGVIVEQHEGSIYETEDLIKKYDVCWNSELKCFNEVPFDQQEFIRLAHTYTSEFAPEIDYANHYGFIEKKDVENTSLIYVRADLHGDLKGLLENLKTLQKQGLLDERFRCKPHTELVFLGDYMDRGSYGMQILQILMALRLENKGQVHLLRGNHEDIEINRIYSGGDKNLRNFVFSTENTADILSKIYQTMPLSLYMGVKSKDVEKKQYVQFTHGMFEVYVDPVPILDVNDTNAKMAVSREMTLSERIKNITFDPNIDYEEAIHSLSNKPAPTEEEKIKRKELKLCLAAKTISEFITLNKVVRTNEDAEITAYNWGDVAFKSNIGSLGERKWRLSTHDIKQYLRLCSTKHKVKMIFRGHQHKFSHHKLNGQNVLVTTLPVGIDSTYRMNEFDRAYVFTISAEVKDWQKKALLRQQCSSITEITDQHPIQSEAV